MPRFIQQALPGWRDGAGAGANVVFGVILGTGVGAGIVARGHLLTGINSIAGEWGHNPLLAPGTPGLPPPLCYCGRLGCVETYLSGPGLSRDHRRVAGESLPAEAIVQRAEEGIALCLATLDRYESRLARSLGTVINLLDPDVIVLGGGGRPFGFNLVEVGGKTRLTLNEHEWNVIEEARRLRSGGLSLRKVAEALRQQGHCRQSGGPYYPALVASMMRPKPRMEARLSEGIDCPDGLG